MAAKTIRRKISLNVAKSKAYSRRRLAAQPFELKLARLVRLQKIAEEMTGKKCLWFDVEAPACKATEAGKRQRTGRKAVVSAKKAVKKKT